MVLMSTFGKAAASAAAVALGSGSVSAVADGSALAATAAAALGLGVAVRENWGALASVAGAAGAGADDSLHATTNPEIASKIMAQLRMRAWLPDGPAFGPVPGSLGQTVPATNGRAPGGERRR